ncbi:nuclear transport factor 2 family protein [Flavihumibacter sp. R14]|nr:nuclear transport factor 2 family protein [Flavihumibacter soli]
MKKLTVMLVCTFIASVVFTSLCQAQEKTKVKSKSSKTDLSMPYKATYSSQFVMGDPANSKLVLEMWKDFDDNAFERHADMLADTAMIFLADGEVIKGRDKMIAGVKEYRNSIASVKSEVHAYMSLKSVEHNENWVAIWGTEHDTWKDGKTTSVELHEIWRLNKDGKIDVIRQFTRKTEPTKE